VSMVITLDGPAGSGKSTVAAALAERLGVPHVDTGAFYRAATLAVLRAGADPEDGETCATIVRGMDVRRAGSRTLVDGADVEELIRGSAVTRAVSAVSRHQQVRDTLVERQRRQIGSTGAIVEGRDAGTVVAPDAELKVWLTASPRERAVRRAAQLGEALTEDVVERHLHDIMRRDAEDAAQMVAAADAVTVDTTGSSVREVVSEIEAHARAAAANR
jgi:cytidylate kinase